MVSMAVVGRNSPFDQATDLLQVVAMNTEQNRYDSNSSRLDQDELFACCDTTFASSRRILSVVIVDSVICTKQQVRFGPYSAFGPSPVLRLAASLDADTHN